MNKIKYSQKFYRVDGCNISGELYYVNKCPINEKYHIFVYKCGGMIKIHENCFGSDIFNDMKDVKNKIKENVEFRLRKYDRK